MEILAKLTTDLSEIEIKTIGRSLSVNYAQHGNRAA